MQTANRMKKKRGTLFIGNFYSEVYISDAEEDEESNKGDYCSSTE